MKPNDMVRVISGSEFFGKIGKIVRVDGQFYWVVFDDASGIDWLFEAQELVKVTK